MLGTHGSETRQAVLTPGQDFISRRKDKKDAADIGGKSEGEKEV